MGEPAAVRQHEHQQPVVVDDPLADDRALIPDVDDAAVAGGIEGLVVQRREARAEGCVPRAGKVLRRRVTPQLIRAVRRHLDAGAVARRLDAAGQGHDGDELALLRHGPAVDAMPGCGGSKVDVHRATFHESKPTILWQKRFV